MTLVCASCGASFESSRRHAKACSTRCRKELQRRRDRVALRWHRLQAWRAFHEGAIDGWQALDVLTMPPDELGAMLRGRVPA